MREHDLVGDVEAEAEISGCRLLVLLRSAKGLEDEREHVRGNGISLVADLDDNLRSVGVRLDEHDRSRRGVLDGVPARLERTSAKRSGSQVPVTSPSTSSWMVASNSSTTFRQISRRSVGFGSIGNPPPRRARVRSSN